MAFACCLDEEAKAQLRVSRAIEKDIENWKKESSREFKLLLLGREGGEPGMEVGTAPQATVDCKFG